MTEFHTYVYATLAGRRVSLDGFVKAIDAETAKEIALMNAWRLWPILAFDSPEARPCQPERP